VARVLKAIKKTVVLIMKYGALVADGQDVLTLRQAPFDPLREFRLIDQLFHL
jgi:hypothetical protein